MNKLLTGITLFLIACVTLFTLFVHPVQLSFGEESMHKNIKLHFQKLVSGVPQDKFYVASFNRDSGELSWADEYDLPKSVKINNESFMGFVSTLPNKHFGVVLQRVSNTGIKYNYFLVNLDSNKVILRDFLDEGGLHQENYYFLDGFELKKISLESKKITDVEQGISAFVVTEKFLWKFTVDGRIIEVSSDGERQIGKFKGVVSEAAHLADDWLCYYQRRNEKVLGYLWLINVRSGKQYKIKKDLPQMRLVDKYEE